MFVCACTVHVHCICVCTVCIVYVFVHMYMHCISACTCMSACMGYWNSNCCVEVLLFAVIIAGCNCSLVGFDEH